eukprot:206964_1
MIRRITRLTQPLSRNGFLYPSSVYTSTRYKTYLVGVDGSDYGYTALKAAAAHAHKGDRIISVYFPTSIDLIMERNQTFRLSDDQIDTMRVDLLEAQQKNCEEIEAKCDEIIKERALTNITAYCKIMEATYTPRARLIKACYDKKADVLVVGSKGLSHSLKEKVTDTVKKVGGLAHFAVSQCPCDVMIVKSEHEY